LGKDNIYASLKYCGGSKEHRYLLLCNVALGKVFDVSTMRPELKEPPQGYLSVHGMPKGSQHPESPFLNDEYVVYNCEQVRMDYIFQVKRL
jgi:poly [ADP-ribose] polymerase